MVKTWTDIRQDLNEESDAYYEDKWKDRVAQEQADSGPSTDTSMSAIAFLSELETRNQTAHETVSEWVQSNGFVQGTTLHIDGYRQSGQTTVYGPSKSKSVSFGGSTDGKFVADVSAGQRDTWRRYASWYSRSQDAGSGGRSKVEYINDQLGTSDWEFAREGGKITVVDLTQSSSSTTSSGNASTTPEETMSDTGVGGLVGSDGLGSVDEIGDALDEFSGTDSSEPSSSSDDQGGLSTTPTDQDSQTTGGDDNMSNEQTAGLTGGTTDDQEQSNQTDDNDQSTGSGALAAVSDRPLLAAGALGLAGLAARKGGVL